MTQSEAMEERVRRGLRRWAEAGEAGDDLAAWVRERVAAAPAEPAADGTAPGAPAGAARRRRVRRWLSAAAAAALLVLGLGLSFPAWAGAAAGWPLVGPVVTAVVLQDAGLRWAYQHHLIQGTLAEARDGEVAVRILGVMADAARTTVIYQITGLPPSTTAGQPAQPPLHRLLDASLPAAPAWPQVSITRVPGQPAVVSRLPAPVATPVGLVGTVSANPLGVEAGDLGLTVRFADRTVPLSVPVTRAPLGRFSREITVDRSVTVGGITVRLLGVTYTPAEILVRYRSDAPSFEGAWSWEGSTYTLRLEGGRRTVYATRDWGDGEAITASFPALAGPVRLVIPAQARGEAADLTWPLQVGASQTAAGAAITLEDWEQADGQIALRWRFPQASRLVSLGRLELLGAAGRSYPLEQTGTFMWWSEGATHFVQRQLMMPSGVTPVAVRARQVGVRVDGPWTFDLPR